MDTLVAILAGLAIFPLVAAYNLSADAGPGLIFLSLPIAFGQMPMGTIVGTLFFIMLALATLTSTIALLEPAISWLTEKVKLSRTKACMSAGLAVWLMGLGSVFSFNIWSEKTLFGKNFFELIDYLTSVWMLPIGSLLVAIFCGWIVTRAASRQELALSDNTYRLWYFAIRYLAPAGIFMIFLNVTGVLQ